MTPGPISFDPERLEGASLLLWDEADAAPASALADSLGGDDAQSAWTAVVVRAAGRALLAFPSFALQPALHLGSGSLSPRVLAGAAERPLAELVEEIRRLAAAGPPAEPEPPRGPLAFLSRRRSLSRVQAESAGCLVVSAPLAAGPGATQRGWAPAHLLALPVWGGESPRLVLVLSLAADAGARDAGAALLARVREELERTESPRRAPTPARPSELRQRAARLLTRVVARQLSPEAALEAWPPLGADPVLDDAWHHLVNYRYDAEARRADPDLDQALRDGLAQAGERLARLSR